jgi:hypothetical protein
VIDLWEFTKSLQIKNGLDRVQNVTFNSAVSLFKHLKSKGQLLENWPYKISSLKSEEWRIKLETTVLPSLFFIRFCFVIPTCQLYSDFTEFERKILR